VRDRLVTVISKSTGTQRSWFRMTSIISFSVIRMPQVFAICMAFTKMLGLIPVTGCHAG
jgi:hypothetical protein